MKKRSIEGMYRDAGTHSIKIPMRPGYALNESFIRYAARMLMKKIEINTIYTYITDDQTMFTICYVGNSKFNAIIAKPVEGEKINVMDRESDVIPLACIDGASLEQMVSVMSLVLETITP